MAADILLVYKKHADVLFKITSSKRAVENSVQREDFSSNHVTSANSSRCGAVFAIRNTQPDNLFLFRGDGPFGA